MAVYVRCPGADYNVYTNIGGTCTRRRLGGKTWEYLQSDKAFFQFKKASAQQPMQLLLNADNDVWLVRVAKLTRNHKKMKLIAEGPKAELWDLFLTYERMLGSQ